MFSQRQISSEDTCAHCLDRWLWIRDGVCPWWALRPADSAGCPRTAWRSATTSKAVEARPQTRPPCSAIHSEKKIQNNEFVRVWEGKTTTGFPQKRSDKFHDFFHDFPRFSKEYPGIFWKKISIQITFDCCFFLQKTKSLLLSTLPRSWASPSSYTIRHVQFSRKAKVPD